MTTQNNDLGPKKGETAAQFKERIQETQREMKRAEAQGSKPTPEAPATSVTPEPGAQVPPPAAPVVTPAAASEPAKAAIQTGNPDVDQWLGKKGFKSTEDMAQSLRELERELHKRAQETKPAAPSPAPVGVNPPPQMPGFPPYYAAPPAPSYGYAPAPYMAPPAPVQPAVDVERLARQYGLDPNDFEKVAAVANDLAQSTIRQELSRVLPPLLNQVRSVDREVTRQREMVQLMSDPAFKNPQVQYEMHRVLEDTPAIFETQPLPYRYAYDQALMRIARANLGGSSSSPVAPTQETPKAGSPAARPPATAGGNGNAGGGVPSGPAPEQVDPQMFARMSLADKREHLRTIGAIGR